MSIKKNIWELHYWNSNAMPRTSQGPKQQYFQGRCTSPQKNIIKVSLSFPCEIFCFKPVLVLVRMHFPILASHIALGTSEINILQWALLKKDIIQWAPLELAYCGNVIWYCFDTKLNFPTTSKFKGFSNWILEVISMKSIPNVLVC